VGSWVLEEPIHFIDLMLWYVSPLRPSSVSAWGNPSFSGLTQDFTAVFEFPNGSHCVISQTLSGFEHHQVVEIAGTEGAIRSLWSGAMDRTDTPTFSITAQLRGEGSSKPIPLEEKSGELFEIQKYLDSALDGIEQGVSLYPPEEERELVRLCLEAERALALKKRIDV
jgi:myo-inositol 2-dehydrogenase/D-chiro-inositol 1-dehydrogenase